MHEANIYEKGNLIFQCEHDFLFTFHSFHAFFFNVRANEGKASPLSSLSICMIIFSFSQEKDETGVKWNADEVVGECALVYFEI